MNNYLNFPTGKVQVDAVFSEPMTLLPARFVNKSEVKDYTCGQCLNEPKVNEHSHIKCKFNTQ